MKTIKVLFILVILLLTVYTCDGTVPGDELASDQHVKKAPSSLFVQPGFSEILRSAVGNSPSLSPELVQKIHSDFAGFQSALHSVFSLADQSLFLLVDKEHRIGGGIIPDDLENLDDHPELVRMNPKMLMRRDALSALLRMNESARLSGIVFRVVSGYRSFDRQEFLYEQNCEIYGIEAANKISARPGTSQHQTGNAIDFFPYNELFLDLPECSWLLANAPLFGFSLSYPDDGYPTGYTYEPWHWRYIGLEGVAFQRSYFADSQQRMLEFLNDFRRSLAASLELM